MKKLFTVAFATCALVFTGVSAKAQYDNGGYSRVDNRRPKVTVVFSVNAPRERVVYDRRYNDRRYNDRRYSHRRYNDRMAIRYGRYDRYDRNRSCEPDYRRRY